MCCVAVGRVRAGKPSGGSCVEHGRAQGKAPLLPTPPLPLPRSPCIPSPSLPPSLCCHSPSCHLPPSSLPSSGAPSTRAWGQGLQAGRLPASASLTPVEMLRGGGSGAAVSGCVGRGGVHRGVVSGGRGAGSPQPARHPGQSSLRGPPHPPSRPPPPPPSLPPPPPAPRLPRGLPLPHAEALRSPQSLVGDGARQPSGSEGEARVRCLEVGKRGQDAGASRAAGGAGHPAKRHGVGASGGRLEARGVLGGARRRCASARGESVGR